LTDFAIHRCRHYDGPTPKIGRRKWPKAAAGDKLAVAVVADTTLDSILGAASA